MTDETQDTPADDIETPEAEAETPDTSVVEVEGEDAATADAEGDDEPEEPSQAAKAIAAMGLTRMSLQELKDKSSADLLAFAEQMEVKISEHGGK